MMPVPDVPVSYEQVTSVAYAETAARTFTCELLDDGSIFLHGPCPRCGGTMTFIQVEHVIRRGDTTRAAAAGKPSPLGVPGRARRSPRMAARPSVPPSRCSPRRQRQRHGLRRVRGTGHDREPSRRHRGTATLSC